MAVGNPVKSGLDLGGSCIGCFDWSPATGILSCSNLFPSESEWTFVSPTEEDCTIPSADGPPLSSVHV